MPDNATLASAIGPELAQSRQKRANAEELLIPRHHLADLAVEQHIATQELQQARRRQQAGQQAVLIGGLHGVRPQRVEVIRHRGGLAGKQCRSRWSGQSAVLDGADARIVELRPALRARLLPPARPELGRRVRRAVAPLGRADGHEQLCVGEQVGNLVRPLIAKMLADALVHSDLVGVAAFGPLGFDHHQWDAVDVAHHIGRAVVRALRGEHLQLLRHVPAVGGGVSPIDHGDGRLVLLAIRHELGDRDAQRQLVVQALVGRQQALGQAQGREFPHDLVDAAGGERIPLTLVFEATGLQHFDETGNQQHLARAAAQLQCLRGAQEVPTQVAEQVQRRDVGAVLLAGVGGGGHGLGSRRFIAPVASIHVLADRKKLFRPASFLIPSNSRELNLGLLSCSRFFMKRMLARPSVDGRGPCQRSSCSSLSL